MESQLEEMVEAAKGFYDKLRLPYQIKIAPAPGVITIAVFLSLLFYSPVGTNSCPLWPNSGQMRNGIIAFLNHKDNIGML